MKRKITATKNDSDESKGELEMPKKWIVSI